jgi:hypothetical protein
MTEYNNSAVGKACTYTNLSNYNSGSTGMSPPVPRTTVSGKYIVPAYSAAGYNTLLHNSGPGCSGYFNIKSAYGKNAGSCSTKYVQRLCQ